MKSWKDSVLKNDDIEFKPNAEFIEDDKVDILITLPLTTLLEGQAKKSFINGVMATLDFVAKGKTEIEDVVKFMEDCELPELADAFKRYNDKEGE